MTENPLSVFQMQETYPHEDDRFYISKEYRNMTREELKAEKEKVLKELLQRRKDDEKNCKI